jgi:hypothetical protein
MMPSLGSAAVSALTAKAKLAGFWDDRVDNKNRNVIYAISDRELTEEEWDEKYCRETADGNGPVR